MRTRDRPAASAALSILLAAAALRTASAQELEGQVLLSDGTAIRGRIFTRGDMPIRVYSQDSKQFRRVLLSDVARIAVRVAKAAMVDEFEWVEMGSDRKIPTGRSYPRKDFEVDVELRTGERLTGHVLGVVYAQEGEEPVKLELVRYMRGEAGQPLESLVHVKEVAFTGAANSAACAVVLETPGAAEPCSARLLGTRSPALRDGLRAEDASWSFANLPEGAYDAIVACGDVLALGLSAPAEAAGGSPLDDAALRAIRSRTAEIESFFTVREAVLIEGTSKAARVLVRMAREEPTTFDSKERSRFYRFEIWTMLRIGDRWTVESRTFLTRGRDPRGGDSTEPRVLRLPALQGIQVSRQRPEARVRAGIPEKK